MLLAKVSLHFFLAMLLANNNASETDVMEQEDDSTSFGTKLVLL